MLHAAELVLMLLISSSSAAWPKYPFDASNAPGRLVLTMLVKNEQVHLERSLPKWAELIDFWVIGIDDANTDNSSAVVRKHLGHIPGKEVTIAFDGMGPSWTVLVREGLESFPEATHGILADADFTPLNGFDKRQLDRRCAKHMFTVQSEDSTLRRMDWVYRNVPGVMVARRTHQMLLVPEDVGTKCPAYDHEGNKVKQTMLDLVVGEHTGGYQDRTPGKQQRYIDWLKKDLTEFPEDGRTLYYLGVAYSDVFEQSGYQDHASLSKAVDYLSRRAAIPHSKTSYFEEKWFAMIKLGEIYERFLGKSPAARGWYKQASKLDGARADSWYYLGQNYRLNGLHKAAWEALVKAAGMPMPERSLFQWTELYTCHRHMELVRCGAALVDEGHGLEPEQLVLLSSSFDKVLEGCEASDVKEAQAAKQRVQAAAPAPPSKGKAITAPAEATTAQPKQSQTGKPQQSNLAATASPQGLTAPAHTVPQFEDWSPVLWSSFLIAGGVLGFLCSRTVMSVMLGSMAASYVILGLSLSGFRFGVFQENL